jgi:WD40 repeat protein
VSKLAFSRDGRTLAVGGARGTLQLWDVVSNQSLGAALTTPGDRIMSLSFSPDGNILYAAGSHVVHQRYELVPERIADSVCDRAGGGFSPVEWRTYIPSFPYRKIC